ncbi:UPF0711 protein C18orf21 homolog isoform X1 [Lethenteron reissneri]|uniref:UPF0711 protein C18orf21 homolog isoform X1 n=1 Tax=Lethenteron reissneri TaxID=7753 RepID=UPI002AB773B4|nr:UPF0711 protein C18orf21 homolog isoform X1 [Lethenteron reissneri]XP_061429464.1 UPF0711 protein C18orf21 homolog isoform X1 [Lethenteron reissneri]
MHDLTEKTRMVTSHLNFLWKAAGSLATACPEQARYLRCIYKERATWAAAHKVTVDRRRHLTGFCALCGAELGAGSCRVRVHPRARPPASPRVSALLRDAAVREDRKEHLERGAARRLRRHRNAAGTISIACFTCKRTSRVRGGSRAEIAATLSHRRHGRRRRHDAGATEGGAAVDGGTARRRRRRATPASGESTPSGKTTPAASGRTTPAASRTPGNWTPTTPRGRATPRASPAATTPSRSTQSPAASTPGSAKRKPFAQLKQLLQMEQQRQQQKGSLKDFLSSI